jgi:hypothetical protein
MSQAPPPSDGRGRNVPLAVRSDIVVAKIVGIQRR